MQPTPCVTGQSYYDTPMSHTNNQSPLPIQNLKDRYDQVVYEVLLKALDLIVRERCASFPGIPSTNDPTTSSSNHSDSSQLQFVNEPSSTNVYGGVKNVEMVRSILDHWKHTPHIPLHLDIDYEYVMEWPCKHLLERWCLEYMSTDALTHSRMVSPYRPTEIEMDPIGDLEGVYRSMTVFLRSLYCMTRMFPAVRLSHVSLGTDTDTDTDTDAAASDDLYRSVTPYKAAAGKLCYSLQLSEPQNLVSKTPFSSNHTQRCLSTPYGQLHLTVSYDNTGIVEQLLIERTHRLEKVRHRVRRTDEDALRRRYVALHHPPPRWTEPTALSKSNTISLLQTLATIDERKDASLEDHQHTSTVPESVLLLPISQSDRLGTNPFQTSQWLNYQEAIAAGDDDVILFPREDNDSYLQEPSSLVKCPSDEELPFVIDANEDFSLLGAGNSTLDRSYKLPSFTTARRKPVWKDNSDTDMEQTNGGNHADPSSRSPCLPRNQETRELSGNDTDDARLVTLANQLAEYRLGNLQETTPLPMRDS